MNGEPTDDALMAQVKQGERRAFDCLFLRHQRGVYLFALRLTQHGTQAEDITQEVFLRVWRARGAYQASGTFRAWLLTITRRLVWDAAKKRGVDTVPLQESDAVMDSAFAQIARSEQERELERALNCLSAALREVIILREMEGLAYAEIARITACPPGTVKSRLSAARARLRNALGNWSEE